MRKKMPTANIVVKLATREDYNTIVSTLPMCEVINDEELLISFTCGNRYKGDDESIVYELSHIYLNEVDNYKVIWADSEY